MIIFLHNVATSYVHFKVTSYFWLLLYPCICMYSAVFKFIPIIKITFLALYKYNYILNIRLLPAWYNSYLGIKLLSYLLYHGRTVNLGKHINYANVAKYASDICSGECVRGHTHSPRRTHITVTPANRIPRKVSEFGWNFLVGRAQWMSFTGQQRWNMAEKTDQHSLARCEFGVLLFWYTSRRSALLPVWDCLFSINCSSYAHSTSPLKWVGFGGELAQTRSEPRLAGPPVA